ncbi:MAG: non-heme iron oxygenase ferredoxin subunit [Candidatus Promineifilaceae bacterium]|nr:non-heme iron oxygenase ferredoxin subunit [Candidatus Promineifilaceae bacterium]
MTEYVKVARLGEIGPGQRKLIDFEEVTVALFNIDGEYYCIEDVCTHDGGPVAEGPLEGHTIACPRHGALFDVRDGSVLSMPAVVPVPTYDVRIEGDDILVESPDEVW